MNTAIIGIVLGIFFSILFIQINTHGVSSKLDDILHVLREIRDELKRRG